MKSALIHVIFLLFEICVCDADIETVSVIEGDSVTLHTDVTEVQSSDVIEWRLNGNRIARISDDVASTEGASRDGMQLDKQTGDLKITSIKTTDSGEYKLKIKKTIGSSEKTFSVSVVSDDKNPSVLLGEYVTLPTGVTYSTQIYDVIQWRFGDIKSPIAKVNRKTGNITYDVPDERFRDRLQLDYWTGSLTIMNTRADHTGVYEVDIIRISKYTIHKTFSVTVSGKMLSVSVEKGAYITLNTDTVLQTYDSVLWKFGDTVIGTFYKNMEMLGLDGRFTDRLELDKKNGSLTIMKTKVTDSGEYGVKIISSKQIIHKKFNVRVSDSGLSPGAITGIVIGVAVALAVVVAVTSVCSKRTLLKNLTCKERLVEVMNEKSVTLYTGVAKVKRGDVILWIFVDQDVKHPIAQMGTWIPTHGISFSIHDVPGGRFGDRLDLNKHTGSLTINNIRTEDAGEYQLKMVIGRNCSLILFKVVGAVSSANEQMSQRR